MTERISTAILARANVLGATQNLTDVVPVPLRGDGSFSIHVLIDNGSGAASTDSPAGTWEIWTSADGVNYVDSSGLNADPNDSAFGQYSGAISTRLPVSAHAFVAYPFKAGGLPGTSIKLRYVRTSGGGGDSRATVTITTW